MRLLARFAGLDISRGNPDLCSMSNESSSLHRVLRGVAGVLAALLTLCFLLWPAAETEERGQVHFP